MRFSTLLLKYLVLAVLILGAGMSDAEAKTKQAAAKPTAKTEVKKGEAAQQKGEWQVGMIKGEKGEFNYCLMRGEFNNDLSLAIALSPKQEINIGVGVPNAGFSKDEKHKLKVKIDDLFEKEAIALAAQPELLLIPMHEDKQLYEALRKGKKLSLTGAEDRSAFALKNTTKALQGLQTCVDVGTGKVKMPAQAADTKTGAKSDTKTAAGKKPKAGDFPPSLKGLLVKAGLTDLEILTISDPKKSPVDFGWKTAGLFGGMRERPVPADATLEKMTDILEGGYKKQCTGTFTINKGAIETYSGINVRNMEVGCDMPEHKAYVSLFIYLTDNHLFTMFMHEGDSTSKPAANKARDAIGGVIRQLAKEQPPEPVKK